MPRSHPAQELFDAIDAGDVDHARGALETDPKLARVRGEAGETALHHAAEADHAELVQALLAAGAELDARAAWGMTPFEWAAALGKKQAAAVLRKRGAQLDLWTASALGELDFVTRQFDDVGAWIPRETLVMVDLKLGECERTQDAGRARTVIDQAFHVACRNGELEVARWLRARGAHVDARGYFGASALHWAAVGGHRAVIEFLVDQGADPRSCDPEFEATAAGWAAEGGHEELAGWLDERERERRPT